MIVVFEFCQNVGGERQCGDDADGNQCPSECASVVAGHSVAQQQSDTRAQRGARPGDQREFPHSQRYLLHQ